MKRPAAESVPSLKRNPFPATFSSLATLAILALAAVLAALLAASLLMGCNAPPGGGTDVGNPEMVSGSLRRMNGEPAPRVHVKLRPRTFVSDPESLTAVVPTEHSIQDRITDTQGFFQFDSVPMGDYRIQAFDSSSHGATLLFSVDGASDRMLLAPAIMDTTGSISGEINYLGPARPGFPKVIIAVFGMERWTAATDSGAFILSDLPPGKYTLRISTPSDAALTKSVSVPSHSAGGNTNVGTVDLGP